MEAARVLLHQVGLLLLFWSFTDPFLMIVAETKPGCQSSCGGVDIPYPFGIGKEGCYLEERFQIHCNSSTSTGISVPILRIKGSTDLEVIKISVDSNTITVNNPIVFANCSFSSKERNNSSTTTTIVDLEGTPFAFSSSWNYFISTGCDNLAFLHRDESTVNGCMSICDKNNDEYMASCSGMNCCQVSIPSDLKVFNVSLREVDLNGGFGGGGRKEDEDCTRYAYLVEQKWMEDRVEDRSSASYKPYYMSDRDYAPAVLDWGIDERTSPLLMNASLFVSYQCHDLGPPISGNLDLDRPISGNGGSTQCFCAAGYHGNPYLLGYCANQTRGYDSSNGSSWNSKTIPVGIGVGVGTLSLLIGVWRLHKVCSKRRNEKLKKRYFKRNGGLLLQEQLSSGEVNVEKIKMFSAKELDKATDRYNVNRMLGQGGQGTVYKGMLADGKIIAVKKSKIFDEEYKLRQFINEVVILSQINHRNVVKLLGCCLETEVPLLVYEFIPNGMLYQFLHDPSEEIPLTWEMRLRIGIEIAGALSYLHSAASIPIYHRDIKSTNILLDQKYRAKIADFGTSKSVTTDQTHVTTRVQGTFGYLDPEYFRSSQFTDKSDVYSFGVVLVELLTGQKAISSIGLDAEARSLVAYFTDSLETNGLFDILDPQVKMQGNREDIMMIAGLAKSCLRLYGKERPSMKEVTAVLEGVQRSHGNPKSARDFQILRKTEYDRSEAMDVTWDLSSTSTGSDLDTATVSSMQAKPLLHTYWKDYYF